MSYLGVQGLYSLEPTGVHVAMQRQLMFDVFIIDSSELQRDRDLAMTNGLELLWFWVEYWTSFLGDHTWLEGIYTPLLFNMYVLPG